MFKLPSRKPSQQAIASQSESPRHIGDAPAAGQEASSTTPTNGSDQVTTTESVPTTAIAPETSETNQMSDSVEPESLELNEQELADSIEHIESQTRFSTEEPFLENPAVIPSEPVIEKPKVPLLKRRKTILMLLLAISLLSLFMLFVYAKYVEKQRLLGEPLVIDAPALPVQTKSGLSKEIETLRKELKEQDPARQELLFPGVDQELRLEERPRNNR